MHYRASYLLDGKPHQLELWRDRNVRLKRRTDDSIETRLFKSAGQTEWQMVVLDLKRRIRTDIDRTNLARIGHFTDWFGQSHGLAHPVGPYQLHKLSARERPTVAPHPAMACQWYALNQNNSNSAICWSAALHLPITITDAHGEVQWHITEADSLPLNQKEFLIDDQNFAKNDANGDIRAD